MHLKFSLLFLGVVASTSGCGAPAAPTATGRQITSQTTPSFTSKERGFAIWLPSQPKQDKQTGEIGNGETASNYIFSAQDAGVVYAVMATPVTPSVDVSDPKGQLDAAQGGFIESSKSKLVKSEDIQLSGFQGREISTSSMGGAALGRMRIYFTPKVMYQLITVGEKSATQKQSAQITKMLDSFRILPQ